MGVSKYTINIEEQVTGGARCSSPKIVWDETICAGITCLKNNGRTIEVSIPDDCDEKCFWVTYTCEDNCTNCDPIRLKVCPCDEDKDCDGCSHCDGNICVSECEDGQWCSDADICIGCDEYHPCSNGEQCVNGDCQCPPSKPYKDSNGVCVPCTDTSCDDGYQCTKDGCVPIECEEGVWNIEKKKCVKCNYTSDCGPNEECIDNGCDCIEGYKRNVNGDCVPDDCSDDSDCGPCMVCSPDGCIPRDCGVGYVCVPELDKCVPICDCSSGEGCDSNKYCKHLKGDICYCADCIDGDCPCSTKPCENGTDCTDTCGCDDDNICRPCAALDCDECKKRLGCKCTDGTKCEDADDADGCNNQDCSDNPCTGVNCTCYESVCTSCSNFSCDDGCPNGCKCDPNGSNVCVGDPDSCKDKFTASIDNCVANAELKLENGCACSPITFVSKITGLKNVGEDRHNITIDIELRKGKATTVADANNLSLVKDLTKPNISTSDAPTSGFIEVKKEITWQNLRSNGLIDGVVYTEDVAVPNIAFDNKDKVVYNGVFYNAGTVLPNPNKIGYNRKVVNTSFSFKKLDVFKFDKLPCSYQGKHLGISQYTFSLRNKAIWENNDWGSIGTLSDKTLVVTTSDVRDPLFKWYGYSDGDSLSEADVFRKRHIPKVSGKYKDSLKGPNGKKFLEDYPLVAPDGMLWGNKRYAVSVDCGCQDERLIGIGKAGVCDPSTITQPTFTSCNKSLKLNPPFAPCLMNQWFTDIPVENRATWELWINESLVKTFAYQVSPAGIYELNNGVFGVSAFINEYKSPDNSAITSAKLVQKYGSSDFCTIPIAIPSIGAKPNITFTEGECDSITGKKRIVVNKNQVVGRKISSFIVTGGVYPFAPDSNTITMDVPANVSFTATVTFEDGCTYLYQYNSLSCLPMVQIVGDGGVILPPIVTVGTDAVGIADGYVSDVDKMELWINGVKQITTTGTQIDFKINTSGVYQVRALNIGGVVLGTAEKAFTIIEPIGDEFIGFGAEIVNCIYSGKFVVSGITSQMLGMNLKVSVNNGTANYIAITAGIVSAGKYVSSVYPANTTYKVFGLGTGTGINWIEVIPSPIPDSITLPSNLGDGSPKVTALKINGVASNVTVCQGDDVVIRVEGTAGSVVLLNSGALSITIGASGYGETTIKPTTTTNYTISSVTNGGCSGTQGVGLARQAIVNSASLITVVSDVCNNTLTARTITFNHITTAKDQSGNNLTILANSVTVDPNLVTTVDVTYTSSGCTATLSHSVNSCNCPIVESTITSSSSSICLGDGVTISVGATGGVAPYTFQYFIDGSSDGSPTTDTARGYVPSQSTVYGVVATDALGCVSEFKSISVTVTGITPVNIILNEGQEGITEVSNNYFEACSDVSTITFKTQQAYTGYAWSVSGAYMGSPMSGIGATFSMVTADITGAAFLTITVTSSGGCTSTETIQINKVGCAWISGSEILFVGRFDSKMYKTTLTPTTIGGVLSEPCTNPSFGGSGIALRNNGNLIKKTANVISKVNRANCSFQNIGALTGASTTIGFISNDMLLVWHNDNQLGTYNLNTNVVNMSYYTVADSGGFHYSNTFGNGTMARIGNDVFAVCTKTEILTSISTTVVVKFTLDGSNNVTTFTDLGGVPYSVMGYASIIRHNSNNYLITETGAEVYILNTTNPSLSTLHPNGVLPGATGVLAMTCIYNP